MTKRNRFAGAPGMAGPLRLLVWLAVLLVGVGLGFLHRSPLALGPLTLAFTVLHVAGKWRAWRPLRRERGLRGWVRALAKTLLIQAILATILYMIGFGLGGLVAPREVAVMVSRGDLIAVGALLGTGLIASVVIDRLKKGRGPLRSILDSNEAEQAAQEREAADFVISPVKVTPENLIRPHRTGRDYTKAALEADAAPGAARPVRAPRAASEAALRATEARLGFTLPESLKAVYRIRDGGVADGVLAPFVPDPRPV